MNAPSMNPPPMNAQKKNIVVVGGGTAGWITATALVTLHGHAADVTLVESDEIGTVGVGEATIPQIRRLNAVLDIDENDFLAATNGSFKLGIEFVGWGQEGERYLHSFGEVGMPLGDAAFHDYWLRHRAEGGNTALLDHSLHEAAVRRGGFARMERVGNTKMAGLAYAFHFDSGLYARFLRSLAEERGVRRVEGRLAEIERDLSSGDVTAVTLKRGERIEGDLFVDCTGFRALLIGGELGVPYEDWSHWLPCDGAIAVPSAKIEPLPPYTRATARPAGWQWRIPLQHRTGNGHVYCSAHMSADEATGILLDNLDGEALAEPRRLQFKTGRRRTFWEKNVVAIGLSSGFLEPLESTSIHLIQSHVSRLCQLLPRGRTSDATRTEYNVQTAREFEQVRDFLILHYKLTRRSGEPFWDHVRTMEVPERLSRAMALFEASGRIEREPDDLFRAASWLMVMHGQGISPRSYSPFADKITSAQNEEFLSNVRLLIEKATERLPSHDAFIERFCRAGEGALNA